MGFLMIVLFVREWYEIEGRIMLERVLVIEVWKEFFCDYEKVIFLGFII